MSTAFIFFTVLTILGLVLYGLERNRPERLRTVHLYGGTGVEDRDAGRLELEKLAIADQRHSLISRWTSPSRDVAFVWRPWHLS